MLMLAHMCFFSFQGNLEPFLGSGYITSAGTPDSVLLLPPIMADQLIQNIFLEMAKKKQVMMFSSTMTPETRLVCKKFMQEPHEISVVEELKLTLHGLLQYYVKIQEKEKILSETRSSASIMAASTGTILAATSGDPTLQARTGLS